MAFNAGAIEATLTLNRNPFTAGLLAAQRQAQAFARRRYEVTLTPKLDQAALTRIRTTLNRTVGTVTLRPQLDRAAFDRIRNTLNRTVGRVTIRPNLDQEAFQRIRERINRTVGRINVELRLDPANLLAIRAQIALLRPTITVDLRYDRDALNDLSNRIRELNENARNGASAFRDYGDSGGRAFSHMDRTLRLVLALLPLLLPIAGAAITGLLGLLGALTAAITTAGLGVGAFAAVAVPAFNRVKDAVAAGQVEIDKLPDGLRQAANSMVGFNKAYERLQELTNRRVGLAMAAGFDAATAAVRTLHPLIDATSNAFVRIGRMAEQYFGSAHWRNFVNLLSENMVPIMTKLFEIVAYLTRAIFNLTEAFMPMATWLLDGIVTGMKDFAQWAANLSSDPRFPDWVEKAKESLKRFWEFLVAVTKFIFEFSYALAPLGSAIFNVLAIIFAGLSKMPPEWLNGIALGLSAIFAAMIFGASGPVGIVIGVLAGIAAALGTLYSTNESVRGSVDALATSLRTNLAPIWDTIQSNLQTKVLPAWESLMALYRENLLPVINLLAAAFEDKVYPALGRVADTLTGKLIPSFLQFMEDIEPFTTFVLETLGVLAIDAIEKLLEVFDYVLKEIAATLDIVGGAFAGDWDRFWQGINDSYAAKVTLFDDLFGEMMNDIVITLTEEKDIIKSDWDGLWEGMKTTLLEESELIKTEANGIWPSIRSTLIEEGEIIKNNWNQMWVDLRTTFVEEGDLINTEWNSLWESFAIVFTEESTNLLNEWNGMWKSFTTILQEEVKNWEIGVEQAWNNLFNIQDEQQIRVNDSWNIFWESMANNKKEKSDRIDREWKELWDSIRGNQETRQVEVDNSWNTFWEQIAVNKKTKEDRINREWGEFWTTLRTNQDEQQKRVDESWDIFWTDVDRRFGDWWRGILAGWEGFSNDFIARTNEFVRKTGESIGRIGEFFKAPINWIIDVVINGGIIKAWNDLMRMVGAPGIGSVSRIGASFSGGGSTVGGPQEFAAGGPILGGIPGKDSVPILTMPGEYVLSKRAVESMGGLSAVDSMHRSARRGANINRGASETHAGGLIGFQAGGPIWQSLWSLVKGAFSGARLTSSYRPGDPGYHGRGGGSAIDVAGPTPMNMPAMAQINQWIASRYGSQSAELIHTPGINLLNGRPHTYGAGTRADHYDHVHWAMANHPGGAGGALGGLISQVVSWWSQIGGQATSMLNAVMPGAIPGFSGSMAPGGLAMIRKMIANVLEAAKTKLSNMFTTIFTGGGGDVSGISGPVVEQVRQVAARYGWDQGPQWDAIVRLVQKESSWNPNAANPSSSARGLFQKMTSLHGPVEATPAGQAQWGLNYIRGKYGTPSAALAFHDRNNWYDNGGVLRPGATLALNGTGQNEFVNTPDQLNNLFNKGYEAGMQAMGGRDTLVAAKLDELLELIDKRGAGATINQYLSNSDPNENARATVLALRMS